jgi:hypothetical protein
MLVKAKLIVVIVIKECSLDKVQIANLLYNEVTAIVPKADFRGSELSYSGRKWKITGRFKLNRPIPIAKLLSTFKNSSFNISYPKTGTVKNFSVTKYYLDDNPT